MPLNTMYYYELNKLPPEVVYATFCNVVGEAISFEQLWEPVRLQQFLTVIDKFGLEKVDQKIKKLNIEYKNAFNEILQLSKNADKYEEYSIKLNECREKYKALYFKSLAIKNASEKFYSSIKLNMENYLNQGKKLNLINENGLIVIVIKGSVVCVNIQKQSTYVQEVFNKQVHKVEYKKLLNLLLKNEIDNIEQHKE